MTVNCSGAMIIKVYADRMAEIIIDPTAKPPVSAAMLVHVMLTNGITAAKIIRIQTAKKSRHRGLTQEGGGTVTS